MLCVPAPDYVPMSMPVLCLSLSWGCGRISYMAVLPGIRPLGPLLYLLERREPWLGRGGGRRRGGRHGSPREPRATRAREQKKNEQGSSAKRAPSDFFRAGPSFECLLLCARVAAGESFFIFPAAALKTPRPYTPTLHRGPWTFTLEGGRE